MNGRPLTIAWVSYFPIEWLRALPPPLDKLPRQHPATWQQVLAHEFASAPELDLHVFAIRKQLPRNVSFRVGNVNFHCLRVPGGGRTLSLFWWETILIRRQLRLIQPDLVHAWGSERGAALVASRLRFPYLVSMQGLLQWYQQQVSAGFLSAFEAHLEGVSLSRARLVTAEASFSVKWLQSHYPKLDVRHVEHAPSWLFHNIQRQPETKPVRFVFVGTVSERKGCDLLFDALDQLKAEADFRVSIIGGIAPAFRPQILKISSDLLKRISFMDKLLPSEVATELARATIAVFPSKADTGPVAVKEAVVAGVPVVGSIVGGIPDYIVPGKNGLLFASGDLGGLIRALREGLAHPLFCRGVVDAKLHEDVKKRLSPCRMADGFLSIYRELARRPQLSD